MTRLTLHGIIVHRLSPWNTNAKMMVQHRNTKNITKLWHLRTPNPTQIPCLNGPYNTSRRRHHPSWTCDGGGGTRGACLPSWRSAWPNGASCLQNKDLQCERQMIQWTLKKHMQETMILWMSISMIFTRISQCTMRQQLSNEHCERMWKNNILYCTLDSTRHHGTPEILWNRTAAHYPAATVPPFLAPLREEARRRRLGAMVYEVQHNLNRKEREQTHDMMNVSTRRKTKTEDGKTRDLPTARKRTGFTKMHSTSQYIMTHPNTNDLISESTILYDTT